MGVVQNYLAENPDAGVVYFESEAAITKDMIDERGIDGSRMILVPVTTVQEFRTQALQILDKYLGIGHKGSQTYDVCVRLFRNAINI